MTEPDFPFTPPSPAEHADVARQIAVTAAALADLAQQSGLVILARLLNLVRMEAEIKLSEIRFRPPADSYPTNKG